MLALPSRVTVAPVASVRSGPALAVGAVLFAAVGTVTVTVSVAVSPPGSVTVSVKVSTASLARLEGAVKVGCAAVVLLSVTLAPAVWAQAKVRVWLSGSELALPSRVTAAPSATRWSAPAFADGASFAPAVTVTVTVSESDLSPSLRVSVKVSAAFAASCEGAVKVAVGVLAPASFTVGEPAVWVQAYVTVSPRSRSLLPLPSRVTAALSATVWSGPALAAGGWLFFTVIVTSSVEVLSAPSVTVRTKVMGVSSVISGAVKVGLAVSAPVRVTTGSILVIGGSGGGGGWPAGGGLGGGGNAVSFWVQAQVRVSSSGSLVPLPSRVTNAPSRTLRSAPAFAVGAWLFAAVTTVTVTVSVALRPPGSVTARVKVSAVFWVSPVGAGKLGVAVVAPVKVTDGLPPVWDQAKVSTWLSGSVLPLPSRVTVAPIAAWRSAPALAVGAESSSSIAAVTVPVTEA